MTRTKCGRSDRDDRAPVPRAAANLGLVVLGIALALPGSLAAQSLSVGDEVIFTGGPGAPPESRNTGTSLDVRNLRFGGGDGAPGSSGRMPGPPDGTADPEMRDCFPPDDSPLLSLERTAPDLSHLDLAELEPRLFSTTSVADRFAAARALGKDRGTDDVRARVLLLEALRDDDLRVVGEAARGLGAKGETRAVEPLVELLNQYDPKLLESVIVALGRLGDPRAQGPLQQFVDAGGGPLDVAARKALTEIEAAGSAQR